MRCRPTMTSVVPDCSVMEIPVVKTNPNSGVCETCIVDAHPELPDSKLFGLHASLAAGKNLEKTNPSVVTPNMEYFATEMESLDSLSEEK